MAELLGLIEGIRKRPAMYIGSLELFGFIHYLVCPFVLLLSRQASYINVKIVDNSFEFQSDASIQIKQTGEKIVPFEKIPKSSFFKDLEAGILNALSESLIIESVSTDKIWEIHYQKGKRIYLKINNNKNKENGTLLRFAPDSSIFKVLSVSPYLLKSYLHRISYLYPGVHFKVESNDTTMEFYSPNGLMDMFNNISAPYQLLHQPIHIQASKSELQLELIFAYHSWTNDWIWTFVNRGRAVENGTHYQGLIKGLKQLYKKLFTKAPKSESNNGVIALMSIIYPHLQWEGCIKAKIGNPELTGLVKELVVENSLSWLEKNPEVIEQIKGMQIFQFPDVWYT